MTIERKRLRRLAFGLALVAGLGLGGCTVYPNYGYPGYGYGYGYGYGPPVGVVVGGGYW